MDVVLKNDYNEFSLGYDIVDWFLDEVVWLENKIAFAPKNTNKDINMTEGDDLHSRDSNTCLFPEK